MPKELHNFLCMISLGKLRIPPEFLLDFEKSQLAHVIGLDRKLKLPHELPEVKENKELLDSEVELRKKHITMIIACFVISKVLVHDVFNNTYAIKQLFSDVPKTETLYFHFYGLTLVALLTDLLFKRFQVQLSDKNPDKSVSEIKNLLFDSLLEPLDPSSRNANFNYDTFRYGPEREKRWIEMEDYFKKMLG